MTILRASGDGEPRSGAAATAARTASCRSPRTRTPTRCRSRSATTASTSSPTRAPTATTASPSGGRTSAPRSATTRSSWTAPTSPSPAGRSCGPGTPQTSVLVARTADGGALERRARRLRAPRTRTAPAHGRARPRDAELRVVDEVLGERPAPLPARLPPRPARSTSSSTATRRALTWPAGGRGTRVLDLPADLTWTAHRGETDPPLGWYSPGFGRREPAIDARSAPARSTAPTRLHHPAPLRSADRPEVLPVTLAPWTPHPPSGAAGCAVAAVLFACTAAAAERRAAGQRPARRTNPTRPRRRPGDRAVCGNARAGPDDRAGRRGRGRPGGRRRPRPPRPTRTRPGTTFWLAPGTHTLGDDEYDQVTPKDGNIYVGAPGAIARRPRQVNHYALHRPGRERHHPAPDASAASSRRTTRAWSTTTPATAG